VSSNERSQIESARLTRADESRDSASDTSLCANSTLSPGSEEPRSGDSVAVNLEGKYLSEFIDLLVQKGARVVIHAEDGR
jgi:hypothetical protein